MYTPSESCDVGCFCLCPCVDSCIRESCNVVQLFTLNRLIKKKKRIGGRYIQLAIAGNNTVPSVSNSTVKDN